MKYIPQLDGVRALAVTLVMLSHFLPQNRLVELANMGSFGVRLFFVLSGYLITHVLFIQKREGLPLRSAAAQFYWKRFLRLSPPYYLTIAFCLVLGIANMRTDFWWHFLYLSNFLVVMQKDWGEVGHLWSLSIEEQFYLVWFFAVTLMGLSNLKRALFIGITGSIAFRLINVLLGFDNFTRLILPGVADFLLFGALLAYWQVHEPGVFDRFTKVLVSPLIIAGLAVSTLFINFSEPSQAKSILQPLIWLFAFGSILMFAVLPRCERYSRWLALPPLVHIGKISYGIYVYHMIIPPTFRALAPEFYASLNYGHWVIPLVFNMALSIIVAEVSWFLIEKPLRRFRGAANRIGVVRSEAV